MTWEGINQRRFPRAKCRCLIHIIKDAGEREDDTLDCFTENLGAGGLCVVLDRDLGLFTLVSLEIFIDEDNDPIKCNGIVVWIVKRYPQDASGNVKYDTGIEFHDIKDSDRESIASHVNEILNRAS